MTLLNIYIFITLIWRGVLQMFYTPTTNTIVLTLLYIDLLFNLGIAPNGSLKETRELCRKSRHPP